MRKGFSVCAKACRCHALLPKKFWRSTIARRRFATLLNLATSAANSSTSPARKGVAASLGAERSLGSAAFDGPGEAANEDLCGIAGAAEPSIGCDALDTRGEDPGPKVQYQAPAEQ